MTSKNAQNQKPQQSSTQPVTAKEFLSPDMLRQKSREALARMEARDKADNWDPKQFHKTE